MATASLGPFNLSGGPVADAIAKQNGYTTEDQQAAFGAWTPDKWNSSLSPELLKGVTQQGWMTAPGTDLSQGSPGSFAYSPGGMVEWHPPGQGPGENYYTYDGNTGNFIGTQKGSRGMSFAQGILGVLGAAAGFGALGGLTGAGAATSGGGFMGDATAAGYGGLGGTAGMGGGATLDTIGTAGPMAASTGGAAAGLGSAGTNGFLCKLATKAGTSMLPQIMGNGQSQGQGGGFGNFSLADLANLGGGLYGYGQQKDASNDMLNWMNGQQSKIDDIYNPNNPAYQNMWQQMSAQDAASGRNSQYGPRTADFLGKIAVNHGNDITRMTSALAYPYMKTLDQRAAAGANLTAPLGTMLSRNGGLTLNDLMKALGLGGSDAGGAVNTGLTPDSSNEDYLNYITNSGGAPIDYAAGSSSPTEEDVLDFINRWGSL